MSDVPLLPSALVTLEPHRPLTVKTRESLVVEKWGVTVTCPSFSSLDTVATSTEELSHPLGVWFTYVLSSVLSLVSSFSLPTPGLAWKGLLI